LFLEYHQVVDGFTSVYVGTAPILAKVLRPIAQEAGVRLWSSQPDIVYGCADAVSVTATTDGEGEIHLPKPMRLWQSRSTNQAIFRLRMREGETRMSTGSCTSFSFPEDASWRPNMVQHSRILGFFSRICFSLVPKDYQKIVLLG
jgi:hypothetical protein